MARQVDETISGFAHRYLLENFAPADFAREGADEAAGLDTAAVFTAWTVDAPQAEPKEAIRIELGKAVVAAARAHHPGVEAIVISGFLGTVQNHMEPMWFFVFLAGLAALVVGASLLVGGATGVATFHFLNPVFGVAIAALLLGEAAIAPIILVLSTDLIFFGSLIVILITGSRDGRMSLGVLSSVFRGLLKNPMIVSIVLGLAWSATGAGEPFRRLLGEIGRASCRARV